MNKGELVSNAIPTKLTPEEKQRLISFFQLLIQIDHREKITPTAQQAHQRKKQ